MRDRIFFAIAFYSTNPLLIPWRSRKALAFWCLPVFLLTLQVEAADFPESASNALFPSGAALEYQLREVPAQRYQDPTIFDDRLRLAFPIYKRSTETWSVLQTVEEFHFDRSPVIAETGLAVPKSLWNVETGVSYHNHLGDRRDLRISASVGSASDTLYHTIHETTFRLTGVYRIPFGENNAWLFLLSYSNNRYFANNIPLPGVAYEIHSADHRLDAVLGFPFLAVSYRPTVRSSGRLSIFGPKSLSAEWDYLLGKSAQSYVGFDWSQREWLRADRQDNAQRLFFNEKKWGLGMRFPIFEALRIDLSTGYTFDRRIYENKKAVDRNVPEVDFKPAWFYQAKLGLKWG